MRRVLSLLVMLTLFVYAADGLPNWYYSIKDVKLQKQKFFEILRPLVEKENKKILQQRAFVKRFFQEYRKNPLVDDALLQKLARLAKKYRIKELYNEQEYLKKIDTIPVSLVLAQAALESGWGKSRFAKEANNLFGEWTYGKHGLVPKQRTPGKKHKIRIFKTIEDSIASYMLNLNRHAAYKEFRMARYLAKKEGKKFDGLQAAMTMQRYSELGRRYNHLVTTIIKKNRLHEFEG
ncbi:glucosaminidase domain-containing protein [Nitratiruptor tergarcus]|uniref:Bax protein n=1 Tax=Nitratiruptor tergarcus DSM 16512 TaxID=1069081 RepID=A0A1W1WRB2_9BACT|nr:glucosaminidase domain-containing protein [Nitratiruptor tergarcus]SMC08755.1 Bax protein [Nitratiruptor tergarcus DSM 16512]